MNKIVGSLLSVITFTPFYKWRYEHLTHHSTVGNLDERGVGDIDTLTVAEYKKLTPFKKFTYRIYRHPIFLFFIASFILFAIKNRFGGGTMKTKDRLKVVQSNLAIVGMAAILIYFVGWQNYLIAQLTILYISISAGIWLFYVQHQYEDVLWARKEEWSHAKISLHGSSFFKLPKFFQWFSGNIGFHHIHHLSPKIPNYNLESCHYENDVFQEIKPLTFLSSFKTWKLRLWDEDKQRLVGFSSLNEA
jgi:omega-6 fatty acid desaturase (delta-12 desaturase)